MSSYKEMVDKDIELMYSIHDQLQRSPRLNQFFETVVSPQPWKDITTIIWIACLFAMLELGRSHFWVIAVNLVFAVGKCHINS